MFQLNKYTTTYYSIIYNAQTRNISTKKQATEMLGYAERHHIIPRCLGGTNLKENLIFLTAREHFICHLLLVKMLIGPSKYKMAFALNRMLSFSTKHNRYIPSSKLYELSRKYRNEAISIVHKGIPESIESNFKRSKATKGIPTGPKTEEHKRKISISKKGKPSKRKGVPTGKKGLTYEQIYGIEKSKELKQLKSEQFKGRTFTDETKEIWSKNRKGKNTGGDNPNAAPVTINGVTYRSKKAASQTLGISLYKMHQLI